MRGASAATAAITAHRTNAAGKINLADNLDIVPLLSQLSTMEEQRRGVGEGLVVKLEVDLNVDFDWNWDSMAGSGLKPPVFEGVDCLRVEIWTAGSYNGGVVEKTLQPNPPPEPNRGLLTFLVRG